MDDGTGRLFAMITRFHSFLLCYQYEKFPWNDIFLEFNEDFKNPYWIWKIKSFKIDFCDNFTFLF